MANNIASFTNAKIQFMTCQHPSGNDSDKYSYVKAITCGEIWALFRLMYIRGVLTQQSFQRHFHVVLRLIWRRDVWQRQVSLEETLCTSALKFTTLKNVESTLSILLCPSNVAIFNVDFHNVGQRRNNIVNVIIWKKVEIKPSVKNKIIFVSFKDFPGLKIFFIFKGNM